MSDSTRKRRKRIKKLLTASGVPEQAHKEFLDRDSKEHGMKGKSKKHGMCGTKKKGKHGMMGAAKPSGVPSGGGDQVHGKGKKKTMKKKGKC